MVKIEINKLKDVIYETEGLLEIISLRPEKLSDISPLIRKHLQDAIEIFESIPSSSENVASEQYPLDSENTEIQIIDDSGETFASEESNIEVNAEQKPPVEDEIAEVPVKEDTVEEEPETNRPTDKPAFCLNDRFRFRRAIFGGSEQEFNQAMDDVAAMSDYDEAEEYFLGYRGLDAEDEDVADFMSIIRAYFER